MRSTINRFASAAAILVAITTTACAEPKPPSTMEIVDNSTDYQTAASALAMATQCVGSPEWQEIDPDQIAADYRRTRDFLEAHAPGRRIFADAEVVRLMNELVRSGMTSDARRLQTCTAMAPAMLSSYRRTAPSK